MRNLKKILLSLGAVAAIAALATGGTFAVFTDEESIGSNDITSGDVVVDLSDGPVIDVADMVIGDTESGTITITNNGANKATYTLTGAIAAGGSALLEDELALTILDADTENWSYGTPLSGFNDGDGIGVVLAPGDTQTYDVEVELTSHDDGTPDNGNDDNLLENLALVQTFSVDAVQRAGEDRTGDETGAAEDLDTETDPVDEGTPYLVP